MAEPSWIGRVLDSRYEIQGVIGRGGMGTVFRARHQVTKMQVALKVLHDVVVDAENVARFLDEARAPSVIGHPAIVEIIDANRAPTGELYFAMQLLFGKSLRAMMGSSTGDDVRRIGLELLDALSAAHGRGFVHRDLKPENIFVVGNGGIKLLDFGIAKVIGATGRTVKGQLLGTLEYMAPEQLLDASRVDARADLWAVGIVLYEMLAGLRPFSGTTFDEKYHALATDLPMPIEEVADVTPEVAAFFARALARDRERRFGSADEMAAALRVLPLSPQAGRSPSAGPTLATGERWEKPAAPPAIPSPAPPTPQTSARRKWLLAAGVVVLGGSIGFGVVAMKKGGAPSPLDASVVAPIDASQRVTTAIDATTTSDAATVTSGGSCEDACAKLVGCKLAIDANACRTKCKFNKIAFECIAHETDCPQIAACQWERTCGERPAGTGRCGDYSSCAGHCGPTSDLAGVKCRCACAMKLRPASALVELRYSSCEDELMEREDDGKSYRELSPKLCQPWFEACGTD